MTKAEFIDLVHGKLEGVSKKDTSEIVQAVFNALSSAIVEDGRFSAPGLGTFNVTHRAERKGRSPRSGDEIIIPASKSVSFKAAPKLKESL